MTAALARQDSTAAPSSAIDIERCLRARAPRAFAVEVVATTGSTNSDLADRARNAAFTGPVLRAAHHQSAGRGRLGRQWLGSDGGSLLFSVALPWRRAPAASAAVTLACAVGAARCLRGHGAAVMLKWPNDLLFDGAKLGGLLTELVEDRAGRRTLIVGLGLNLAIDAPVRESVDQPVAELAGALGREAVLGARAAWLAWLADALLDAAQHYDACGLADFLEDFNDWFAWRGLPVQVDAGGGAATTGVALGIDRQGQLLVEGANGTSVFGSGEIRLRRMGAAAVNAGGESMQ